MAAEAPIQQAFIESYSDYPVIGSLFYACIRFRSNDCCLYSRRLYTRTNKGRKWCTTYRRVL